jgi:hypothetical protein
MKILEGKASPVKEVMSGKMDRIISPDANKYRTSPSKHEPIIRCKHCGYKFGFDIELGYHTDHQGEIILIHQDREDKIYDMAYLNPDGVTFKSIDEWFRDAGNPQPLATLHGVIKNMLEHKVLKSEETKRIDTYNHNRKTIVYHAVPLRKVKRQ